MRVGGLRPLWAWGQARDMGGRTSGESWEARIELLNRVGLRGYFLSRWALPRCTDRANKHQIFG
jgi:hypothetical protein